MGRDVSVVLITFNSAAYLPRCLDGLAAQQDVSLQLIVIDNDSRDESVDIVRHRFPAAVVIRNDSNRGFAAAANQGIRASNGELILLLNPDVFLEPSYVARVADRLTAQVQPTGSAAGKLRRARGVEIEPTSQIDSLGVRMTRSGRHFDDGQGESDRDTRIEPFEVFGVTGAAAMYRRAFLDDVAVDHEYFDERFFAYREDVDLAWRGRLRGWRAIIVPDAIGYHVRRVTPEVRSELPPEINMHSVKNRFLLRINNQGRYLALRNLPFELLRDIVVIGGVLLRERSSLPALAWLWQHRAEVRERRRMIQSRRRVSDRELARWFR